MNFSKNINRQKYFEMENMPDVISRFPEEAYEVSFITDTCCYRVNGYTCTSASMVNDEEVIVPACSVHYSDFILALSIRENMQRRQQSQPQASRPTPFANIPLYIEPSDKCSVCTESDELLSLPCRHVACFSCYERLENTCPMCRAEIVRCFVRRLPTHA